MRIRRGKLGLVSTSRSLAAKNDHLRAPRREEVKELERGREEHPAEAA